MWEKISLSSPKELNLDGLRISLSLNTSWEGGTRTGARIRFCGSFSMSIDAVASLSRSLILAGAVNRTEN